MNHDQDKRERRVVAIVTDLFFGSRISATARAAGVSCTTVRDAKGLEQSLTAGSADLILVDLSLPESTAHACLRLAVERAPEAERVAYYSHVQHELAEAATRAGATRVLPHSQFVVQLEAMMRGSMNGEKRIAKGTEAIGKRQ